MKKDQRARIEDGVPVPDVRRREIRTFDLIVDDLMDLAACHQVAPNDPDERERFEAFLRVAVRSVAHSTEWSIQRAVESAVTQAVALMSDPERYKRQRRNRKAAREAMRIESDRQKAAHEEYRREKEEELRDLEKAGRLATMPWLQVPPRPTPKEVPPTDEQE